ncbi:MAG: hypothetical protein D6730_22305 [Bacteroidetes bacterium]|nr:MAG: hypothetical protein D6730_22305 [Bacteroidota bacterium]
MARRRVHIEKSFDYHRFVIGVASNERIWKLCWELNRELGISLKKRDIAGDLPPEADQQAAQEPALFQGQEVEAPGAYYEDTESKARMEFVVCTPKAMMRELTAYRYLFIIRFSAPAPDISSFLSKIQSIPAVIAAVDLSTFKNINQIVP